MGLLSYVTIILYVLTIILYKDHQCLLYQNIYIDKNGNTIYIKSNYFNNVYLIINYKSKHAHLLCIQFQLLLVQLNSIPLVSTPTNFVFK